MMKASGKWSIVSALFAMGVLATGCGVSQTKYLAATQSAEEETAKGRALQSSLDAANQENEKLKQQVAAMQSTVDQVNAELEKQKSEAGQMQSTYENLVGQLKGELSSGQIEIQQMRDGIRVNLAQDILFKSGSASLDPTGKELLARVAEELKGSNYQVLVTGHTDDQKIGPLLAARYPTNWELGSARASQIVRLFQAAGIASPRMMAVSAGEAHPRASNDTPEGRTLNRRIEIRLRPVEAEETASN